MRLKFRSKSTVGRKRLGNSRLVLELLEDRTVPTPYYLTTGVGDGSVRVGVDGFGAFGTSVGSNSDDAIYDPIGATAAAGTVYEAGVAIRFGLVGGRTFMTSGSIGSSSALPNPTVTGTATMGTSNFSNGGLNFSLVQTVAPSFAGAVRTGAVLTQTYTITNPGASTANFELVFYMDGWLQFDGTLIDGGGRLAGPPETLFETDAGATSSTSTTFVGTTATGGLALGSNRYTFDYWSTVRNQVEAGTALDNIISGDSNSDGFVESPYDPARALRNVFALAPSGTTVYTIKTIFGSGTPASVLPGVSIVATGGSTDVAEGGATDTYTVVLNAAPSANVTVNIGASSQLTRSSTSLVFTTVNWNVARTVTVTAVNDGAVEGAHTGVLAHTATSSDSDYTGLTLPSITANITDNDVSVVYGSVICTPSGTTEVDETGATDEYTVELSQAPAASVTVTLSGGSGLTLTQTVLTFTTANWNVPQSVLVAAVDDSLAQGDRTVLINHAAASTDPPFNHPPGTSVVVTIHDDELAGLLVSADTMNMTEGDPTVDNFVQLTSQPLANVTISLTPGTQATVAPSVLTFTPANWNVPQLFGVRAIDDQKVEGPTTDFVSLATRSSSVIYANRGATVTVNIDDNDFARVIVTPPTSPVLMEGTGKTYTVALNTAPAADVVVAAMSDAQVTVSPAALTFTQYNWSIPRTVTVTAVDDADVEGTHAGLVIYATSSGATHFDGLPVDDVAVQILDNDATDAVNGTAGNDTILVNFSATLAQIFATVNGKTTTISNTTQQLVINAGAGTNSITITNPTIPISVMGGINQDNVNLIGQTTANQFDLDSSSVIVNGAPVGLWSVNNLIVTGSNFDDTFTLSAVPTFPVELKGDVGKDHVTAPDLVNTWSFTGSNNGLLDNIVKLTAIEYWHGGTAADTFTFSAGRSLSGRIDGGGGYDVLDYSALTTTVLVNVQTGAATGTGGFANIAKVRGGKGAADKLTGPDQSNLWSLTALNLGDLNGTLAFEAVENLTGGSQDDTFQFANNTGVKGKIDGAGGSDLLSYASYLSAGVTINLQTLAATNTGGWLNLESFVGGNGTSDLFIAANKGNTWNLTDVNTGTLNGTMQFTGFDNMQGGTLTDTFNLDMLGKWTGTLSGAAGKDTLIASPMVSNAWLVPPGSTSGTLNGRNFSGIEVRQ